MKKTYAYSPDTGEIINTDTPAAWMLTTPIVPPSFDSTTAGCFFRNGAWEIVISTPDTVQLANDARARRNALIAQSDWSQLPDAPLTVEQKNAWALYRQSLRDISRQPTFPVEINWPSIP